MINEAKKSVVLKVSQDKYYKVYILFIFQFFSITTFGQKDINSYLSNHHYTFTLDRGFDDSTQHILREKLSNVKVIIQGEISHVIPSFYDSLNFIWLSFLNKEYGLKHYFLEWGVAASYLENNYLQTGDSLLLPNIYTKNRIRNIRKYNLTKPTHLQLSSCGLDFERLSTYKQAIIKLIPNKKIPSQLQIPITQLHLLNDDMSVRNKALIKVNKLFLKAMNNNEDTLEFFFGSNYSFFKEIITNPHSLAKSSAGIAGKHRDKLLADNFIKFDSVNHENKYFVQIGMGHTVLKRYGKDKLLLPKRVFSNYLNNNASFKEKTSIVNVYSYNCFDKYGKIANNLFKKIDDDIQRYFLPYCESHYTLFDLSENPELANKYSEYGQFLIIIKDIDFNSK